MCKILHAIKRAKQRYGIFIGADTILQIGDDIRKGNCQLIEKRTNTVAVYDVGVRDEFKGTVRCRVVYSKTWKFPVTFLAMPVEDER